jgi:hypothetical protein
LLQDRRDYLGIRRGPKSVTEGFQISSQLGVVIYFTVVYNDLLMTQIPHRLIAGLQVNNG